MSSSRRLSNPRAPNAGHEPFPAFPSSPGPQHQDNHVQTSGTTTTTTTILDGRNTPFTTTTHHQPGPSSTPAITTTTTNPEVDPHTGTQVYAPPPQIRRRPIGIRRLPSSSNRLSTLSAGSDGDAPSRSGSTRGRSTSSPQPSHLAVPGSGSQYLTRPNTRQEHGHGDLETLREESTRPQQMAPADTDHLTVPVPGQGGVVEQQASSGRSRRRSLSNAARSITSKLSSEDHGDYPPPHEYETEVVDLLDVIGKLAAPFVSTQY